MRAGWAWSLLLAALLLALGHLLDPWAWSALHLPRSGGQDWHRLLRVCGFWPTWLALALALALQDRHGRRAGVLVLASGLSGLAAHVGKLLIRRQRPDGEAFGYAFSGWPSEGWWEVPSGLGMPSGHTAVAFGAAWALRRLFPRGGWVVVALAAGCGLTRVLERAHFLSDVVAAALLAWLVEALLARVRAR